METQTSLIRNLTRVEMYLYHVLYISYLVPESRVRQFVPKALPLALVHHDHVFVSVVILRSVGVRLSSLPLPRFTYNQINIRTYVRDPLSGQQAVFFLQSGVTSSYISLLTRSIGIPWQHISVNLNIKTDMKGNYLSYGASGVWDQPFSVITKAASGHPSQIDPFENWEQTTRYLIQPLKGFFTQKDRIMSFSIWHTDVNPQIVMLKQIHFPLLHSLNLLGKSAINKPDSILLVPNAYFYIYMPPNRV